MSKKLFNTIVVLLLVVGLLFAVAPKQAQAAEMCTTACYVSPNGSDSGYGIEEDPFLTIQKAIDTVSDGGTIYLAEGNYVENPMATLTLNKSFSLIGASDGSGNGLSTIQGTLSLENSLSTDSYLIEYINFKQVSGTDSLVIKQIDNLIVRNSVFAGAGALTKAGIQMNSGANGNQNILVDNCRFENLYYLGIQGTVNYLTVKDSEFENLKSGINLQSGGSDLTVTNSTFNVVAQGAANDTYGIRLASSTPVGSGESLNVSGSTFNVDKAGFVAESGTYHAAIIIRAGALGPFTVENNQINGDFVDESSLANLTTIYGANTWPVGYGVLGNKITLAATLAMDPAANAAICGLSGTTTVAVKVGPVDQLSAYDVTINFDKTLVEIVSVTNGDVLIGNAVGEVELGNDTGTLFIRKALIGAGGVWNTITDPDGGTLVLITLKHKTTGTAVLTLDPRSGLSRTDEALAYPLTITQGTSTLTVGNPIVAIGTTEYCTLGDAVTAAAGGDILTVLRNFAVDATVDITKQLTLNTATYTVSFTPTSGTYTPILWVKEGGNLTITGTGTLNSVTTAGLGSAVRVSAGGDLTLNGATLSGGYASLRIDGNTAPGGDERAAIDSTFIMTSGKLADGFVIFGKGAEATINGGLVQSETEYAAISGFGTNDASGNYGGTKITINGGTVQNNIDAAIFHPQDGDLIITGGWVEGATGIIMKSGNLDISGPSHIYANGAYAEPIVSGSGQNSTGDAILIYGGAGYTGDITVNIHQNDLLDPVEMGQVTSEYGFTIREFSDTTTDTRTNSVLISGGTFEALEFDENKTVAGNFLFTEQLRNRALADEPNDTLLLTGGYYVDLYDVSPAYYVFPPLETYYVAYTELSTSGYRIREMAGQLTGDSFGFVKYDTGIGTLAGITSGWTLSEVTVGDVASAEIRLYGGVGGTTLLQTNTAIQLDRLGTEVTFTSPFDIYGDYRYADDGFWTNGRASEYGQTLQPTCVEATVLLKSGKELTDSNCDIAGTYDSIKPLPVISSTDIQGYYLVGEEREFHVSMVNPLYGVQYSKVMFKVTIPNAVLADITTAQFFETGWPQPPAWYDLHFAPVGNDLVAWYGGIIYGGFPLNNDDVMHTEKLRVNFADDGTYDIKLELYTVTGVVKGSPYDYSSEAQTKITEKTFTMNVYDKPFLTISQDPYFLKGVAGKFAVRIQNPPTGVPYGDSVVFYVKWAGLDAEDITAPIVCSALGHEWTYTAADFEDTAEGLELRLDGEDSYFTVPVSTDVTVTCSIVYNKTGAITFTDEMVHVTDKLAVPPTERTVSDIATATANVYDKPTVTVTADPYYLAGVPGASTVTIVNPTTGYNYDNAVWFDMMIDVIADNGVSAFSCTMNGHTWSGLEAGFNYTGAGATLRLGGADGYFTVNANQTLVVDCTITYANAGTYQVSGNMLHVTDKLSDPKVTRVVSDNYSATANVYDKPTLTISQDPYFIAGEAGKFAVRIQNPTTGVPFGNSVVFYLKWAGLNAADIAYPLDCSVGTQHWLYEATDFVDTTEGLQLRLDGADSYFTVTPDFDYTVTCSITYNKTGEIAFTDEMVHVYDKTAPVKERTVSDVVSATAKVFTKPTITSADLPGTFQQGVAKPVTITVANVGLMLDPNSFTLHLGFPEGTVVVYDGVPYTCGSTGCDIPVTLAAGSNTIPLTVTFNAPYVGPLTVDLMDRGFEPDRTLATLPTTLNSVVHANVASVTGTVTMQGRSTYNFAKFTLTGTYLGYGPYPSTTSNAAGQFSFANIIADEYTITTEMPRYLNIPSDLLKKISLPGVDNVMASIKLRAGNAVWFNVDPTTHVRTTLNNVIDLDDAGLVGGQWYGPGSNDLGIWHGDVNFDNIVNIQDLALVGGNMDLTSADAYGTWLP